MPNNDSRTILAISEAISAWDLILKPRGWPLYNDWKEFAQAQVKAINIDTWNMLWKFICEFPKDMKSYDEDGNLLVTSLLTETRLLALDF